MEFDSSRLDANLMDFDGQHIDQKKFDEFDEENKDQK